MRHVLALHAEWASYALQFLTSDPERALGYVTALEGFDSAGLPIGQPGILARIMSHGEPCPWHDESATAGAGDEAGGADGT